MTNNDEMALKLKAAAEKATPLNLDSAEIQRGSDGYYECPMCCGAGEVEAKADFCNIDGVALGVQFYGIGEHHGAAEEYFRAAAPANILSLLAERDADKKQLEQLVADRMNILKTMGVYVHAYEEAKSRIAELEARTVSVKFPRYDLDMSDCDSCGQDCGADMSEEPDGDYVLFSDVVAKLAAAGINLEVGE